jgi:glycosyltransferase involved in cell wall biosynthesis
MDDPMQDNLSDAMPAPRPDPSSAPKLAYLVSMYPAVSHTFILREIAGLRARGLTIETASINRPDRASADMDAAEAAEARATFGIKAAGLGGAAMALGGWALRSPRRLLRTLRLGVQLARRSSTGGWRGLAYATEAAMVARWMQRHGARHLHVHFANAAASVGVLVKALNDCHLSITVHGPDEFDDVHGQQLAFKVARADAVVCISQFARGQLMRLSHPDHWPKLSRCRLGVDPAVFQPRPKAAGGPVRLLCVGRLTPAKGQVLLVRACAQLRATGVDFTLTLIGDGPDRGRLEQEIARHALQTRVTLTGALGQARVRRALGEADVFVLPSLAEGIPVVLMEAMSSGVPCISTPVNGIPELIEDGRTGLLARPGDVPSLADALIRLARDASLRSQMGAAGRQQVQTAFDIDRNLDRLAQIFRQFPAEPEPT